MSKSILINLAVFSVQGIVAWNFLLPKPLNSRTVGVRVLPSWFVNLTGSLVKLPADIKTFPKPNRRNSGWTVLGCNEGKYVVTSSQNQMRITGIRYVRRMPVRHFLDTLYYVDEGSASGGLHDDGWRETSSATQHGLYVINSFMTKQS